MKTTVLFLGDNGRITCGDLRCAGATAYSSGMTRDLSGQPLLRLTKKMLQELTRELASSALVVASRCAAQGRRTDRQSCPGSP